MMKHTITEEQLHELSATALSKYYYFVASTMFKDMVVAMPQVLLSVSEMIEFLGDQWWYAVRRLNPQFLCDDLWEAVKSRLEEVTTP